MQRAKALNPAALLAIPAPCGKLLLLLINKRWLFKKEYRSDLEKNAFMNELLNPFPNDVDYR